MKRQSLAALRRLARETADTLDCYADKLADQTCQVPVNTVELVRYRTETRAPLYRRGLPVPVAPHREPETVNRIPLPGTPWQVIPTPDACRDAAAALRRNPGTSFKTPGVPHTASIDDTARDARRLYGDNAAAVLRRQIATIDPDDYHGPSVRRWKLALDILDAEDAAKAEAERNRVAVSREGVLVVIRGAYFATVTHVNERNGDIYIQFADGRRGGPYHPDELKPA